MKKVVLCCVVSVVCLSSPVWAFVSWTNSSGSTAYFDWANGGSDNGLYGDPTIMGSSTFVFYPEDFRAESADGGTDTVFDQLVFDLSFHEGFCLSGLKVTEYGDYGVLGDGVSVDATGVVSFENLLTSQVISETIVMDQSFPVTSGSANWKGVGEISDLICTNARISISNELIAISSSGSTAYIQKKVAGSAIAIEIIPEPATMCLLGLGGLLLRRRRA